MNLLIRIPRKGSINSSSSYISVPKNETSFIYSSSLLYFYDLSAFGLSRYCKVLIATDFLILPIAFSFCKSSISSSSLSTYLSKGLTSSVFYSFPADFGEKS